jgi:hypothetical protein
MTRPEEEAMTRLNVRRTLSTLLVAGVLGSMPAAIVVTAQESSPVAEESGMPEGFASETLALALTESLPEAPAILMLDRLTLEPGAALPGDAGDPSLAFVLIQEGAITVVGEEPLQVTRADALAEAMSGEPSLPELEEIASGEAVVIAAGDSMAFPSGVAVELRNEGDAPAVMLASLIVPMEALAGE